MTIVHIGFTGTQSGMTERQRERLWAIVGHRSFYFHHGDCVGADAEADMIVRAAPGLYGVVMHPCDIAEKRGHCAAKYPHDIVRDVKKPLERDDDIVAETECLVAASKTEGPVLRSGTWATIRRAVDAKKPVCVIYPSGALVFPTPGAEWPGEIHLDGAATTSPCMRLKHREPAIEYFGDQCAGKVYGQRWRKP